jgi:hypothetical protein
MTPNKKYEVLQPIEIGGAIQEVGAVIELPEAEATQHVQLGALKEVEDNGGSEGGSAPAPTTPETPAGGEGGQATPAPEAPAPAAEPAAPAPEAPAPAKEGEEGWAGNHVVGGNENAPLRTPHPDLNKEPAEAAA